MAPEVDSALADFERHTAASGSFTTAAGWYAARLASKSPRTGHTTKWLADISIEREIDR